MLQNLLNSGSHNATKLANNGNRLHLSKRRVRALNGLGNMCLSATTAEQEKTQQQQQQQHQLLKAMFSRCCGSWPWAELGGAGGGGTTWGRTWPQPVPGPGSSPAPSVPSRSVTDWGGTPKLPPPRRPRPRTRSQAQSRSRFRRTTPTSTKPVMPGEWCLLTGALCLVPGALCLVPCAWCLLVPGALFGGCPQDRSRK